MDLYSFGCKYSYTPDIEIEKRENKFGIIYLPTGEILLPFEYENIMINREAINNFFVIKNGLFGAVHFEGGRYSKNDFFAERSDLPIYIEKPKLTCDVPCEYDYFYFLSYGDTVFFNKRENVYLYVGSKNITVHFTEIHIDDYHSVWGKKDNTLYLISSGKIRYEESFKGFRFCNLRYCHEYVDFENNDRLLDIGERYILVKYDDYLSHSPRKNLCFYNKIISFEYYSMRFTAFSAEIEYSTRLLGIREKNGARITPPFAHTLQYVGKNRFIANCKNGKFGLCVIDYCSRTETEVGTDNYCKLYPEFILKDYDYVNVLGKGYYKFIKEGAATVIYDSNNGIMKNHF